MGRQRSTVPPKSRRRSTKPPRSRRKPPGTRASERDGVDSALARGYKTAPVGLASFDTELRYLSVNDWLAAINGLSTEEHLGRKISEVLPDVAQGVEEQLRSVIKTRRSVAVRASAPVAARHRPEASHEF